MVNHSVTKDSSLCAGSSQLCLRSWASPPFQQVEMGTANQPARPCRYRGEDQRAEVSCVFFGKLLTHEPTGFVMFRGDISNVLTELSKLNEQRETIHIHTGHVRTKQPDIFLPQSETGLASVRSSAFFSQVNSRRVGVVV